jgi:FtsH-binding integral membrane protein
MKDFYWLMYVGLAGGIVCMCVISCATKKNKCSFARKVPCNYVLLTAFTLFWSLMVACFTAFFNPFVVVIAATVTAFMTIGLVTCSMCVKSEMTWLWGIAGAALFAMWPMIIISWFWRSYWLSCIISFFGVVLASIYIVIDIKMIMKHLELDEYIIGALMLYADIISLFMWLLSLLGGSG